MQNLSPWTIRRVPNLVSLFSLTCAVAVSCPTFAISWTTARQASLSFTISQSPPKFMSIELVMSSNHFILCRPLLLLPSIFPLRSEYKFSHLPGREVENIFRGEVDCWPPEGSIWTSASSSHVDHRRIAVTHKGGAVHKSQVSGYYSSWIISYRFPLASHLALPDSESIFSLSQGPLMCECIT